MPAEAEAASTTARGPDAEPLPLPRGDMRITMFLDGFVQEVILADLFLLLGRTAAAPLDEPFEVVLRFEIAAG